MTETEETIKKVTAIHNEAIDDLITDSDARDALKAEIGTFIQRFRDFCTAISILGEISPRASDAIGGMGEQMSVRILAAYMSQIGMPAQAVDATELIVTDSNFTNATPLIAETNAQTCQKLQPIISSGVTPVVTGFIAATADGVTTTLGRGGSDYSGAIIGRALNAKEVWIWTDVDGVMTTDPRLVDNARTISELTYREVSELAYYGAKVLHPRTMRPVTQENIPLRIKNTFNPDHPGTVILQERDIADGSIMAVTSIKDLVLMTIEGRGMLGVPGVAARAFKSVANTAASVLMITQSSSEQSICFSIPAAMRETVKEALETEFAPELSMRDIDRIWSLTDVSIVTAVGAGMAGAPGVAGRMFTALGESEINIMAIAQGSSECSISVIVETKDAAKALQAVHTLIVSQ
ncbi:MAG: aspartate kinase [Chloroflexota bacterium]